VSDLKALREVEGIRVRRVDQAEDRLRRAQQQQREAEEALEEAKLALFDYLQRLPGLIEQVYADCIGYLVSREFVQDKVHEEGRLRARVADYRAKVTEAEGALKAAIQAVLEAQQVLNRERVKLDAMREMIKEERKLLKLVEARAEAKVLDELASSKFVRAMRKAA
jgi:flagellar biosynthesis chaperone FliJ